MSGPLRVVQALQRTACAVAAGQRGDAAAVLLQRGLLPRRLVLEKPQRVHLHWPRNPTGNTNTGGILGRSLPGRTACIPHVGGRPIQNLYGFFWEGHEVWRLDVCGAAGVGPRAMEALS